MSLRLLSQAGKSSEELITPSRDLCSSSDDDSVPPDGDAAADPEPEVQWYDPECGVFKGLAAAAHSKLPGSSEELTPSRDLCYDDIDLLELLESSDDEQPAADAAALKRGGDENSVSSSSSSSSDGDALLNTPAAGSRPQQYRQ